MQKDFPRVMLVDMNSFFASVEQQANPGFRGKPVGVCASLHETSCLIAASKEAKAMGVKTGTLIYKARQICPQIILVQSEPEKYREVNRRINAIFADYTDRVESYSIDESFLDLREDSHNADPETSSGDSASQKRDPEINSGLRKKRKNLLNNPLLIGAEIKQRIREEVGEWLICSVGIAENKFLAKLAADMQKPDGLSVVWRSNLPEIYKYKKLSDLWGVAHGWVTRLARLGITSPLQLLGYPVQNLISLFGKSGYYIWERINGLEKDYIRSVCHSDQDDKPKSFGNSWVLNFRTTEKERLKNVILRLSEKASRRMRKEGMVASGMYLSITEVSGNRLGKSKKLKHLISTGQELYEQVLVIWKDWEFKSEVMQVAVGFTHLAPKINQMSFFWPVRNPELGSGSSRKETPKQVRGCEENLTVTLDKINDKYGEFTIRSGLLTRTSDFAPDAIAFAQ